MTSNERAAALRANFAELIKLQPAERQVAIEAILRAKGDEYELMLERLRYAIVEMV